MTKELRRCPFCGGEAEVVPHLYYSIKTEREECDSFHVECKNCQSQGYAFWGTEEQAIKAWNRRKPLEDIIAKLESRFMAEENRFRMGVYLDVIEMLKGVNNETD